MKIKNILYLLFVCFINISYSYDINFYLDNKHISYQDVFINELAIKYNYEFSNNFGITTIGRFLDKKGNNVNLLLYYDNNFHRFEVGNYDDISFDLQSGIINITNNVFNNDYIFYYKNSILKLISRPTLLSNQNLGYINNLENFNKSKNNINFNYFINIKDNLTFGLTYINKYNFYYKNKENIYNLYKYGLYYNNQISELEYDFSFIGESSFNNKFNSCDVGVNFNYYGILFGGNYGFGKDLDKKRFNYNSYGLGYEIGSLNFAIWYFNGSFDFNNSINFDMSYNINKNINIYSEFSTFKIKNKKENSISIGILVKN